MPARNWISFARRLSCSLVFLLLLCCSSALAQFDPQAFQRDLSAIASQPRVIGSEGYRAAQRYIEEQLAAIPGIEVRTDDFDVMVPVTRRAVIEVPAGGEVPVYPFWPAQVRLNTTPLGGIKGKLVYVGTAQIDELKPKELAGQIAVVEASAGQGWQDAAYYGAQAVVVLGNDRYSNADLRSHELLIPAAIPRFFLPQGEMADRIRRGEMTTPVALHASANWEKRQGRNIYALIPAAQAVKSPTPAMVLSVAYDSSGLVPDLAVGASQAVQAAAGLGIARDIAARPLSRPVLIFFGGGDSIQFLATRQMLLTFGDVPATWRAEIATLKQSRLALESERARLLQLQKDPRGVKAAEDRELLVRLVKTIETQLAINQDELFSLRMTSGERPAENVEARIAQVVERQADLTAARYGLTREPRELENAKVRETALEFIQRTLTKISQSDGRGLLEANAARLASLEHRIALYEWMARATGRPLNPGTRTNNSRVLGMLIAVDLSDAGVRFGPMYWGWHQASSTISHVLDVRDWFNRARNEASSSSGHWYNGVKDVLDIEPLGGSQAAVSWLVASMAIGSELCPAWGVPGFTMMTLDDLRSRRDTPLDTVERINVNAIVRQGQALATVLRQAWDDPKFKGPPELKWARNDVWGRVVSPAPGRPVPDLPREGFLATWAYTNGNPKHPSIRAVAYSMGLRRNEVRDCDPDGVYRFEGLPVLGPIETRLVNVQVYDIEKNTGGIQACSDFGRQASGFAHTVDLTTQLEPMRSLVFRCRQATLVGLSDPRFLQDLNEIVPLDARRNAEPQRFNVAVQRQIMTAFFEPDMRAFLIFRYGRIGNRLVLLNSGDAGNPLMRKGTDDIPGIGFRVHDINKLGPLSLATSQDFFNIDEIRLKKYAKAGVRSELIDSMHSDAREQIGAAVAAYEANKPMDLVRHANGAWANEARVYQATQEMANDVIRGAIFLLLLCVPFAFCMERLLVGTPNIYRQITGLVIIFAIMALAMWAFHPAFQISSSPLIIILSFAIIFMSVVVISVVYGKFDSELKRIRSGRGTMQAASFARASVLMSAVLLGIANMRRRKFRTALTSITIVLITFAVLCFTSATRYLDTVTLPTGEQRSHAGVMLRQRGWRVMPVGALDNLRSIVGSERMVARWWNVNPADPRDMVHVTTPGNAAGKAAKLVSLNALLGLSPGESQLSSIAEVIGTEDFQRLERGERNIIYMATSVAEQLGATKGSKVLVGGLELEVAGLFDALAFDRRVNVLSGEPISPLKYSSGDIDAGGRLLSDQGGLEGLDLDAGTSMAEVQGNYEHLSATQYAIVPEVISRQLPNWALRSISFKLSPTVSDLSLMKLASLRRVAEQEEIPGAASADKETLVAALARRAADRQLREPLVLEDALVKDVSDELSRRFAIAIFAGFSDGVKMVAASNLASVSGAGQVAIPLAIAGLIIFNTMMGSIAERKREIHVYTSLGLAPLHVGALFLAEAMTYGLIGAVFGYVIGQGIGTAMTYMGWLGGVTLNYSGTSAIMTLGLILLIVLLSALVPARLASRIAAPSIDRNWHVPEPKDGRIVAQLPFTINKTAAEGALAYLAEFFDAHQEGSIGKFSSGKVEAFTFEDENHRQSRGLKAVIWLTPFDLGVRQQLMLLIHPGQYPDIYEVQVVLERLSGSDANWYRMNRSFLTELRKQFLQWRSLTPQRMLEYVQQSQTLFARQSEEIVSTLPGESVRLG